MARKSHPDGTASLSKGTGVGNGNSSSLNYYAAKRQRKIFQKAMEEEEREKAKAAEDAVSLVVGNEEGGNKWVTQKLEQYKSKRSKPRSGPKLFTFHPDDDGSNSPSPVSTSMISSSVITASSERRGRYFKKFIKKIAERKGMEDNKNTKCDDDNNDNIGGSGKPPLAEVEFHKPIDNDLSHDNNDDELHELNDRYEGCSYETDVVEGSNDELDEGVEVEINIIIPSAVLEHVEKTVSSMEELVGRERDSMSAENTPAVTASSSSCLNTEPVDASYSSSLESTASGKPNVVLSQSMNNNHGDHHVVCNDATEPHSSPENHTDLANLRSTTTTGRDNENKNTNEYKLGEENNDKYIIEKQVEEAPTTASTELGGSSSESSSEQPSPSLSNDGDGDSNDELRKLNKMLYSKAVGHVESNQESHSKISQQDEEGHVVDQVHTGNHVSSSHPEMTNDIDDGEKTVSSTVVKKNQTNSIFKSADISQRFRYYDPTPKLSFVETAPSDEMENRCQASSGCNMDSASSMEGDLADDDDTGTASSGLKCSSSAQCPNNTPAFSMSLTPIPSDEIPENEIIPTDDHKEDDENCKDDGGNEEETSNDSEQKNDYDGSNTEHSNSEEENVQEEKGENLPDNFLLLSPQDVYNRLMEMASNDANNKEGDNQKSTYDPQDFTFDTPAHHQNCQSKNEKEVHENDRLLELISIEGDGGINGNSDDPSTADATTGIPTPTVLVGATRTSSSDTTKLVANFGRALNEVQKTLSSMYDLEEHDGEASDTLSPLSNAGSSSAKQQEHRLKSPTASSLDETWPHKHYSLVVGSIDSSVQLQQHQYPRGPLSDKYEVQHKDSGVVMFAKDDEQYIFDDDNLSMNGGGDAGFDEDYPIAPNLCTEFNALSFFASWCKSSPTDPTAATGTPKSPSISSLRRTPLPTRNANTTSCSDSDTRNDSRPSNHFHLQNSVTPSTPGVPTMFHPTNRSSFPGRRVTKQMDNSESDRNGVVGGVGSGAVPRDRSSFMSCFATAPITTTTSSHVG